MKWFYLREDISRKEGKLILKYMQEIIDEYGFATLADFYDLKLTGNRVVDFTDTKKVWRSLAGSRVSLIRKDGRYRIKLPDFEEIL